MLADHVKDLGGKHITKVYASQGMYEDGEAFEVGGDDPKSFPTLVYELSEANPALVSEDSAGPSGSS